MTESDNNLLRRELAAIAPVGEHPDADVLSAFAEGTLLKGERAAVLTHLAGCAECREVLSLAAAEVPTGVAVVKPLPVRRPARVWIPWGAVAAGILIACGVAVYKVVKTPTYAPMVAQREEAPPVVPAQETAQLEKAPEKKVEMSAKKAAPNAVAKNRNVAPPLAQTRNMTVQREDAATVDALKREPGAASGAVAAAKQKAGASPQARDLPLNGQPSPAPGFASPDAQRSAAEAQTTSTQPHWHLNEKGQPQRAFGDGAWQPALPGGPSRMHVVSIIGGEVWTGGENSEVYRSTDEGATWQAVILPAKSGDRHTIVHIQFENRQTGTIEAADGTTWLTNDGGNTWR